MVNSDSCGLAWTRTGEDEQRGVSLLKGFTQDGEVVMTNGTTADRTFSMESANNTEHPALSQPFKDREEANATDSIVTPPLPVHQKHSWETSSIVHLQDTRPRNINVAFLGDSISRFAYISLAYYLHTGEWVHPTWSRQPCNPGEALTCTGDKWKTFNEVVTDLLGMDSYCDCHRGDFDTRYFWDPIRNNRVSFFMRGGHSHQVLFRGRIDPATIWSSFVWGIHPTQTEAASWEHAEWDDMIRQQLGRMKPVPEYVVLNAGLWPNRFSEAPVRERVLQAAREVGIRKVIWRTTTYQIPDHIKGHNETLLKSIDALTDRLACQSFDDCIDLSFTARVHRDYMYDWRHFREPVNRLINEETLHVLGYLPSEYKRLNASIIFQPYNETLVYETLASLLAR